ncbi:MAG: M48 family metalloprotease [Epsilonproteobacteria bacterium]|nr:M48 family metalloprotease [Campylobacterota bacterium]
MLAHEVGHLHDNRFQILAKTHYPTLMLDMTARFSLFYAVARFFLVTGFLEPRILIIPAGVLTYFSLKHILLAAYFRHLEYRADRFSLQCFDDLNLPNVHHVMSNITKNITSEINTMCKAPSNASFSSRLSSWFMKTSLLFSTFRRHPAVAKRIKRLQALSKQ